MLNQAPNSMTADGHFCAPALLGRRLIASLEATERLDGWLAYKGRPTPQPEPAKAPAPKKMLRIIPRQKRLNRPNRQKSPNRRAARIICFPVRNVPRG